MAEETEMVTEALDSRAEIRVLVAEVKQQFSASVVRDGPGQYKARMSDRMGRQLDAVAEAGEEDNSGQIELLGRLIRLSAQESVHNIDDAVRNLNALISRL